MKKNIVKVVTTFLSFLTVLQLYACGTLMYPERRGQKRGEIDVKVAILDGIGLLFFIIPGVVAYIIDFDTGAIYLPAGKRNMVLNGDENMRVVMADKKLLHSPEYVQKIVSEECNLPESVNWNNSVSYHIDRNGQDQNSFMFGTYIAKLQNPENN